MAIAALSLFGCTERSLQQLGRLQGSVMVAAGIPAAGATIGVAGFARSAVADATGGFSIEGLPFGPHTIVLSAESTIETVKIVDYLVDDGATPLVVMLTGLGTIEGTVRDEDDQPIAGAHVALGEAAGSAVTGPTGRFSLRAPVADCNVVVVAPGFAPWISSTLRVGWDQTQSIAPTLRRETSTSMLEATIVRSGESDHAGTFVHLLGTPFTAQTDSAGRFAMANVPDGLYSIAYEHGGFRDQLDDVLLTAGRPYLLTQQLEPLGVLELLPAVRLAGRKQITTPLSVTAQIVLGIGRLSVINLSGVETYADEHAGSGFTSPTLPSISPLGTHFYHLRRPLEDGAQTSRVVRAVDGAFLDVPGWGQVIGWRGEDEVVLAVARSGDPVVTHELMRVAAAGPLVPLGAVRASQLFDMGSDTFAVIDGQRLELRSALDAAVLWQADDVAPVCAQRRCVFRSAQSGTYQVLYPDGAVVDTGLLATLFSLPVWPSSDSLFGPTRAYFYDERRAFELPAGLLSTPLRSSRDRWLVGTPQTNPDQSVLYALGAAGYELRATIATHASARFAQDDRAAIFGGTWLSLDATQPNRTIDCPSCRYVLVTVAGALASEEQIASTSYSSLVRIDGLTGAATKLAVPPLRLAEYNFGFVSAPALDRMTWIVRPEDGKAIALGHDVEVARMLDPHHVVLRRTVPPAGDFVMVLP